MIGSIAIEDIQFASSLYVSIQQADLNNRHILQEEEEHHSVGKRYL